jgi:hypothetical protein
VSECPLFLGVRQAPRYVAQRRCGSGVVATTDQTDDKDNGLFTPPERWRRSRMIDAGGGVLLGKLVSDALK